MAPAILPAKPEAAIPPAKPVIQPANDKKPVEIAAATPKDTAFSKSRYRFMTGLPAGETVRVRDDEGNVLFTYRSFASVIGIVASLVASIVIIAGLAATLFLIAERSVLTALAALVLSVLFALVIVILVPSTAVTLFNDTSPALTIAQKSRSSFPAVTFTIVTPDGQALALLRKSIFSRLGRNRWRIDDPKARPLGFAEEESLSRALLRKIAGKFDRRYEANVIVYSHGEVARITRRPDAHGDADVLEITRDTIDQRVIVALATLVLGSEP